MTLDVAVTVIALVVIVWWLWWAFREGNRYRYDPRNQYRRYCTRCGQEQNLYVSSDNASCWESMGETRDVDCRCHGDTAGVAARWPG